MGDPDAPVAEALVAGVDGCPGDRLRVGKSLKTSWVVVTAAVAGGSLRLHPAEVLNSFADVLARTEGCGAVAVDMPIGLADAGTRTADLKARKLLGPPRASSVFPAPARCALAARYDYAAACDASFLACGRRLSRQAFGILPRIAEVDAALTPALQSRVVEAHPEVSFAMRNGGVPMRYNKLTSQGRHEREAVLSALFDTEAAALAVPSGAKRDDLYDACILTWTAARLLRGEAQRLPPEPQLDSRGLRMEIVY